MEVDTIQCLPKEQCTGCAACANRCPTDCISMRSDEEGFLYPKVEGSKCIRCGICKVSCPVLNLMKGSNTERLPDCYAAWSRDEEIRFHSTSGGVFTHLAQAVLAQGGCVAGARYRADHLVEHTLISNEADLETLRQSKYVQSETGLVYREIKAQLEQGKPVLFAGTPCQCAGLQAFLGGEYDGLFLCDLICRGVNSPKVYLTYLHELEDRYGSPVKQVWFKNKTYGWNRFCTKIIFEDGQEYLADRETDPFMLGYIKSKLSCYMRPSCYDCKFKGTGRPADITLGDYWGIDRQLPEIDSRNGVSLVMINSSKGAALWDSSRNIYCQKMQLKPALQDNSCYFLSVNAGKQRSDFYIESMRYGFGKSIDKLANDRRLQE